MSEELKGSASKNQSIENVESEKLVTRTAKEIQNATRDQLESLSDIASEQFCEAATKRTAEKLAMRIIQNADSVVEAASDHLLDFLPKIFDVEILMAESELDQMFLEAA